MTTATNADSTTWSSGIAVTTDTPVQCQAGSILVTWDGAAVVGDGLRLEVGQMIVVPAGATFRWAPAYEQRSTIFYSQFGV